MPIAQLPGNLQMYYEDDDFTDPWTTAETVILHHGNAKNARLWYAWVPLLARDYRVIRVDARGFGRSSIPAWGTTGPSPMRGHLARFCEDGQVNAVKSLTHLSHCWSIEHIQGPSRMRQDSYL
jgi:pimeloyl-ACP methyl ester carboxylesterase